MASESEIYGGSDSATRASAALPTGHPKSPPPGRNSTRRPSLSPMRTLFVYNYTTRQLNP